jgi:hypothetical protein
MAPLTNKTLLAAFMVCNLTFLAGSAELNGCSTKALHPCLAHRAGLASRLQAWSQGWLTSWYRISLRGGNCGKWLSFHPLG